jgi:adenine-specific DNA-methyltransferase
MDKLKMHSPDLSQENIAKIRELFPNCVTEARDEKTGKLRLAVDFDLLRQELSDHIVEGPQERYRLDWPGKREALALANVPIAKTLRSSRDESVDFDKTKNLFIEGDNLEALKILQTPMLGKVKLIYIDPPYNTGNDFVYDDDFSEDASTYFEKSNQTSDVGERLVANTESNGRFHSDWLTMIYPRLKVARSLISDDGAIFISVDEGEKANLRRICDEIFGEENYRNTILVRRRVKSLNSQFADNGLYSMNVGFEYVLIYAKSRNFLMNALRMKKKNAPSTGTWNVFWSGADRPTMRYELLSYGHFWCTGR